VVIVGAAFVARAWLAASTPFVHDEYQWKAIADTVAFTPGSTNLPLHGDMHPPGQVYWAALGTWIFGTSLLGYRAAAVVLGTLAVYLMYHLGRRIGGPRAGIIAALLLAANEYHLGVSRLNTEKTYLTFALLALLLFERVLRQRRTGVLDFVALGAVAGLAIVTKQTAALLVAAFGVELLRTRYGRGVLRTAAPWSGAAAMLVVVSPDIVWNLLLEGQAPAAEGAAFQLSKLTTGTWSWGPTALYARPFYFNRIEAALNEYTSMTTIPGLILVGGSIASLAVLRSSFARFLQVMAFALFLAFSCFSTPVGEFWWSDLTLLPFVALTAGTLARLRGRGRILLAAVLVVVVAAGWKTLTVRDNHYPLDWGAPPADAIDRFRHTQWQLIVSHRDVDHLALCTFGTWRLPPCDFYRDGLAAYDLRLASPNGPPGTTTEDDGWDDVSPDSVAEERRWATSELARFDEALGISAESKPAVGETRRQPTGPSAAGPATSSDRPSTRAPANRMGRRPEAPPESPARTGRTGPRTW
jgi:hypothetical protein